MFATDLHVRRGETEDELSKLKITYVDGMHDRWSEAPQFFSHI